MLLQRLSVLVAVLVLAFFPIWAQNSSSAWQVNYQSQRAFVENKGQFDQRATAQTGDILYAAHLPHLFILFWKKGISYQYKTNGAQRRT